MACDSTTNSHPGQELLSESSLTGEVPAAASPGVSFLPSPVQLICARECYCCVPCWAGVLGAPERTLASAQLPSLAGGAAPLLSKTPRDLFC